MNQDEAWLLTEKYGDKQSAEFFADCERLQAGEPLAYVIGFVPFLNSKIWLDSRPLIPRTETEFWVEKMIQSIKQHRLTFQLTERSVGSVLAPKNNAAETSRRELQILDLCAGSGCVGVAIGNALPQAQITLAEIDEVHLPTIVKNCSENNLSHCTVIQSDLFENVSGQFNWIATNPPYIDPILNRTEPSVKSYEPHLALYGGRDGTELIREIIDGAPNHLTPSGQLWLEHEPEQSAAIKRLADQAGFITTTTHTDQYGVERFSVLTMPY